MIDTGEPEAQPNVNSLREDLRLRDDAGPFLRLAARALLHGIPARTSDRERRLLASATQLGKAPQAGTVRVVIENAHAYLALACCSWAANASHPQTVRDAALVAAIAVAASIGDNPRSALGVEDRLVLLSRDTTLDEGVRSSVAAVLADPYSPTVLRALEDALDAILKRDTHRRDDPTRGGKRPTA